MKPYVICHMVSSVDGRIWGSRWRPKANVVPNLFETLHDQMGGGLLAVRPGDGAGIRQGQGAGLSADRPEVLRARTGSPRARPRPGASSSTRTARRCGSARTSAAIAILVILTEQVPDLHLAGLRADGISYIFAGKTEIDLAPALETLNRELGIERLMLEGGGGANGALLRAGLVDEMSLVITAAIDGSTGAPTVFNSGDTDLGPAPIESMTLTSHEVLENGAVWLRYKLTNPPPSARGSAARRRCARP